MDHISKKRQLASLIDERLTPLIDNNYVLYGLPYYTNIGDTLIWNGELEFLKKLPYKCVGTCPWNKYPGTKLPENVIILITGGGYFGDLWRNGWEYVLKGIEPNLNNKIIFLPGTVYYENHDLLKKDAEYLAKFPNFIICVRDKVSFELASNNFSNKVILIPDMAFYMNEKYLRNCSKKTPQYNALFIRRQDKEFPEKSFAIPSTQYDTHDWETMENPMSIGKNFYRLQYRIELLSKRLPEFARYLNNLLYKYLYRVKLTKIGCSQIASYHTIYTTRLHAMILACLIGREAVMIDSKFGKLSSFYDTWLTDCDNIKLLN